MKLTAKLAEALVNLRGNRDFAVLLEGLKEHETEELKRCVEHEGAAVHRAQGAVKAVQWWMESFRDAPAVFEKFKQSPNRGQNTP